MGFHFGASLTALLDPLYRIPILAALSVAHVCGPGALPKQDFLMLQASLGSCLTSFLLSDAWGFYIASMLVELKGSFSQSRQVEP